MPPIAGAPPALPIYGERRQNIREKGRRAEVARAKIDTLRSRAGDRTSFTAIVLAKNGGRVCATSRDAKEITFVTHDTDLGTGSCSVRDVLGHSSRYNRWAKNISVQVTFIPDLIVGMPTYICIPIFFSAIFWLTNIS